MFSTVLGFPEGRIIVPFLRRRPQVFPRVKVIMNLKRLAVLLDNVFSCEFCEIFKKTFFSEHVRATVSEYSRIEFCVNIAQLIILSYPATPRKMFLFKNTRALFYFSSTIDGNTDTVHLIEGFVF